MVVHRPLYKLVKATVVVSLALAMVCSLLFIFSTLNPSPVTAAPLGANINADVTVDTTWYYTDSPYIILTNTVSVLNNAVLTIEPGVEVRFTDNAEIHVQNGRLVALGTTSHPITFTAHTSPTRGSWEGIIFGNNAQTSTIQYATIEYPRAAVQIVNNGTAPIYVYSSTIRYAGDNDNDLTTGGAIVGGPDISRFAYNRIYSSEVGIRLTKAGTNQIINNEIFDIDGYCVGIFPSSGLNAATNRIVNNTIYNCENNGIRLEGISGTNKSYFNQVIGNVISNTNSEGIYARNQQNLLIQNNIIYNTAFTTAIGTVGSGSNLGAIALIQPEDFFVLNNQIYSNGGNTGIYQGALYIADTYPTESGVAASNAVNIRNNLVLDNYASGLIYTGVNTTTAQSIHSNAICVDTQYEIENQNGPLTAEGNWLGTNFPVIGTEITGTVDIIPPIQLTTGATPTIVPADGLSAAVITVTMNDGALPVHTVPLDARQIDLTTDLGTLADTSVTLNSSGTALTSLTSTTPGTATITVTELCGYVVTTTVVFQATDVEINKSTAVTQMFPGQTITYTIPYTNNAGVAATNVVITDTLPTGVQWLTDTAESQGFTRIQTSPEVVWTHPSLPGGASGSITLVGLLPDTATATCGTTLTNSVVITTATVESNISNNSGSAGGVQVLCADVGVTKSTALTQVLPGGTVTYTIAYSNSGNAPAQNLVITDTLPANVTWLTDTAEAVGFARQQTPTAVGWSLPSLAAGSNGIITLVGQAQSTIGCGNVLTNSVTITTTTFDSNVGNQSAVNNNVSIVCADVTINKVGPAGTVLAGDTITYTLTYTNSGTAPATNVVITDVNPISGGIDTLVNGITLNPGQNGSIDYPVVVDPAICAANPAASITNTGFISTGTPESDTTNNSSSFSNNVQCLPDLVITKTRISNAISLGRPITFTLEYQNTGVYTAPNTTLTDTLPAGVIYITDTSSLTPITGTGTVAWDLGDVGPGQAGIFEVVLAADTLTCSGSTISYTNQVEIDSVWPDADPSNNFDTADSNNIPCNNVDLVINKNDGVGGPTQRPFVWAGDVITYTITYLNVGGQDATGVVITETLPAYTTFVGPVGPNGWAQVGSSSQYVYTLGTVPSMNGDRLYFIVQVNPSLPTTVTVVNNEIRIDGNEPDALPVDNVSYEQTPVQATADLAVDKASLTPVAHPGGQVTYAITVTNQGSVTATNVVITDTLPTGTTYVTNTVIGAPVSVAGNTVVWNVGQLNPGQILRFDLTLQVDSGTGICSTAFLINTIEAQTDVPEGDYSNNTAATSATSSPAVACRDVEITKTVDDPQTSLDRDVVFTLAYGNPALITATNVVVTDTLPTGLTMVDSNPSYASGGGGVYEWNLPNLSPGITGTIVITAHTTSLSGYCGATLTNTAEITTTFTDTGADEYPGNNVSIAPVSIYCVPDLVIVKNDRIGAPWEPPFVQIGDVFTYSIIYSNIGIGSANNVVITETLPANTSFVGPAGWTQVGSTNLYTYGIGTVAQGAGFQVEFAVQVDSYPTGGFITNTVCIGTTDDEGPFTDNNCSGDQTLVDQNRPRLNVTKTAIPDGGSTVFPGDTITYTVVVLNDGMQPANNILITDTLPLTEVSFVAATLSNGNPVYGPNPLTSTVISLPVNSAVTMTVEVLVNNVVSGTLITNIAEAIADTLSVQQSLPVTHVVGFRPVITTNLAITKTGQVPAVTVGTPAIYDITVTNQSAVTATNVTITDTMPAGSGYLSDTSGLTATVNLNTVTWDVGQLDPGETYTFSLTLSTNQTACVFRPLTNTITVGSDEFEVDLTDNTDTATTGIFCNDLYITKAANTPQTTPDQDVVFTLTYINPGLVTATNVVVSDTLPSGINFVSSTPTHSGPFNGQYHWTPGDVGPGITGTIVITGHVGAGVACDSVLTNTAIITTTATDENPLNNTDTASVTVLCGVNLSLVKNDGVGGPTEPPFVQVGDVITYSLSYNNLGTEAGHSVVITEALPANTNFVGPTGANGWYPVGGNQYTYTLNTVNAGNGGVVSFVVQVISLPPGGFITNTACIGSIEPDVYPRNNCTSDQTLVTPNAPRLQVTKSADPASGSAVQPDEVITYTVVVLNNGQATASNVRITDTLPLTEVSFITATLSNGAPVYGPNPLTATIGSLLENESITMTVVVSVNNVLTGTVFTNTAQAVANTLPVQMSLPVTHVVTPTIPVTSALTINKSADPPSGTPVDPGDTITYTLVAINSGGPATNVVLTDAIPGGTAYVPGSATANFGTVNYNGSALVVNAPVFSAGFMLTTTFQVTVTTNYTTVIQNGAFLVSDQTAMTNSNVVTHPVRGTQLANVYLPIIFKNFSGPSASLAWAGQGQDRVSEVDGSDSQAFVADGRLDGAFLLTVYPGSGAKTVDNVRLVSSQGAGAEWDTIINTVPILGIFDGSTRLNNADGTVGQTINGQIIVTIYGSDDAGSTRFPPDTYDYTVTVTFTDGTSVSATARIPAPPPPVCYIDVAAEITVGDNPRGVVVDEARNRAYVANYGSDTVSVVDTGSNTVIQTISGITTANGITHDPVRNIVWVTNYSTDRVTPIDANTGAALALVPVGDGPWGVAFDPVHNYVYVVNNLGNSVTVIDAVSHDVVSTLSGNFDQPYHIAANPETGKVYVPNFGDHTVTVINGTTINSVINLNVGDPSTQPYGVAVDETRNAVYVTTVDSHRIVVIDGAADEIEDWAVFHRGNWNPVPHRPVPMRAIAVNPTIPSSPPQMEDGGHVWATTSTGDGGEANQTLMIPKGGISDFHSPVPCDVGINPTEGIAINRGLDRAYVTSGSSPGSLTVFNDNSTPPLVPFSVDEDGADYGITVEIFKFE